MCCMARASSAPCAQANCVSMFMAQYGIDVLSLINSRKLELHYSEFGLGGGGSYGGQQVRTCVCNSSSPVGLPLPAAGGARRHLHSACTHWVCIHPQVASSPAQVALRPFFGIYGDYTSSLDPWALPSNRAFLREFYSKAIAWLSDPAQTTYRVSSVFVWR